VSSAADRSAAAAAWVSALRRALDPAAGGHPIRDPSGRGVDRLHRTLAQLDLPPVPHSSELGWLQQLLWVLDRRGALTRGRLGGRGTYLLQLRDLDHPVWDTPGRGLWARRGWTLASDSPGLPQLLESLRHCLAQGPVQADDGLALFDLGGALDLRQPLDFLWRVLTYLHQRGALQLELSDRHLGGRGAPPGLLQVQMVDPDHPVWSNPPGHPLGAGHPSPSGTSSQQRVLEALQQGPVGGPDPSSRPTRELAERAGFPPGAGSLYNTLGRLVETGLVIRCTDQVGRAWRWQLVGRRRGAVWLPAPLHQRVLARLAQQPLGEMLGRDQLLEWLARDVGAQPGALREALGLLQGRDQIEWRCRGRWLSLAATGPAGQPAPGGPDPPGETPGVAGVLSVQQAARQLGWEVRRVQDALARGQLLADPEVGGVLPESLAALGSRLRAQGQGRPDPLLVAVAHLAWWDWPPGSPQQRLLLGILRGQGTPGLLRQLGISPRQLQRLLHQIAQRAGLAGLVAQPAAASRWLDPTGSAGGPPEVG